MASSQSTKKLREVPAFRTETFSDRKTDYCVCIFVINEGEKLHKQLRRMQEAQLSDITDVVVADGGSTDGSTDTEVLQQLSVNTLLVKEGSGKLGAQMRMAFSWALDRGYQGVVVIDGNNKDSVEDIPHFVAQLKEGYDHLQGSRFIPGGQHENTPMSRLLGLKVLHVPLMRLSSGFKYTDTTNGFRAYSRALLEDDRIDIFREVFAGYELHYYLAARAPRLGFKCCEVPVSRKYPSHGKLPTKISPIRGNLQVVSRLLAVCFGKYNPPRH